MHKPMPFMMPASSTTHSSTRSITELRAVIDGFAARYAAQHVKNGMDPEPLLLAFERLQAAAKAADYSAFILEDRTFHLTIVALSDVEALKHVWRLVGDYQERFRAETLRNCWPDLNVLFEAHRAIVDFICDGDAAAAELAAREHLDAIWYRLAIHANDDALLSNPLDRACAYLAFNLAEPIRLSYVARQVARTSPGHLARLFREKHGASFSVYLRSLRMHKAADMLLQTNLSVQRIAKVVGYQDGSRFARHFKQFHSVTPIQFRRQTVM